VYDSVRSNLKCRMENQNVRLTSGLKVVYVLMNFDGITVCHSKWLDYSYVQYASQTVVV
jgi:hypothetical protein